MDTTYCTIKIIHIKYNWKINKIKLNIHIYINMIKIFESKIFIILYCYLYFQNSMCNVHVFQCKTKKNKNQVFFCIFWKIFFRGFYAKMHGHYSAHALSLFVVEVKEVFCREWVVFGFFRLLLSFCFEGFFIGIIETETLNTCFCVFAVFE